MAPFYIIDYIYELAGRAREFGGKRIRSEARKLPIAGDELKWL
jgi:hypothetical protein